MIQERTVYDQITVLEDGQIQLRQARILSEEDGTEINRLYWRGVVAPGDDVTAYPSRVQAICGVVWTAEVVQTFLAARDARQATALAAFGTPPPTRPAPKTPTRRSAQKGAK